MTMDELRDAVVNALAEVAPEVDVSAIERDVELRDQIEIDSMDLLNFVIGVRERTGVDVPERDYAKLATLDDVVRYLSERLQE